jgi:DNA-directed RNA polymerase subunit RPC12/RpoP
VNVLINEVREDTLMCPYCNTNADICGASLTSIKLEKLVRLNRCSSESYSNCALFLAKSLRLR